MTPEHSAAEERSHPSRARKQAVRSLTVAALNGKGFTRSLCHRRAKGVAIIMVIAVLTGLLALAAPFVLSMVLHGRTARGDLYALQAQLGAEAAIAHAQTQLVKLEASFDPSKDFIKITTLKDLKVTMDFPAAGPALQKLEVNVTNPRGLLWSAKVEDEQGKINLSSAPPVLLGNLLGSAILMDPTPSGSTSLMVDDSKQFNPGGGCVCLNGERRVLHYSSAQGNMIQLTEGTEMPHVAGDLVYDGRGRLLADYKIKGGGPQFTPFRSIFEVKMALSGNDSISASEFARIEGHLTVHSEMNGPLWGHSEYPQEQGNLSTDGLHVEKADGFTPGVLIRVVDAGVPGNYARVRWVTLNNVNMTATVVLDNPV
ncbi:MAG: hypothetical protein ABSE73_14655, partial [Planctomycetota bacterium]